MSNVTWQEAVNTLIKVCKNCDDCSACPMKNYCWNISSGGSPMEWPELPIE